MQIDNISAAAFCGKPKFLRGLKPCEKEYAKQLLDTNIGGMKNRDFLSECKFDLRFYNSKNNPSSDTLYISTIIKYLDKSGRSAVGKSDIQLHEIDIASGVDAGAEKLRSIMQKIESDIDNKYPTYYNTWLQKIMRS